MLLMKVVLLIQYSNEKIDYLPAAGRQIPKITHIEEAVM